MPKPSAGAAKDIPPFIFYPPQALRARLSQSEWRSCYAVWATLAEVHSELSGERLTDLLGSSTTLLPFLLQFAEGEGATSRAISAECRESRKQYLKLIHRILTTIPELPRQLLQWQFLGYIAKLYGRSNLGHDCLLGVWTKHQAEIETSLEALRKLLIAEVDSKTTASIEASSFAECVLPLSRLLPHVGAYFFMGSDLLDSVVAAYPAVSEKSACGERLVLFCYLGLTGLISTPKPNVSLLADHLYTLKSSADSQNDRQSLTANLVTETPFLHRIRTLLDGKAPRAEGILTALSEYQKPQSSRSKRPPRRRTERGKTQAAISNTYGHKATFNNLHVHRLSLISQIQDLFPDLGSAFIVRLLDEYDENVELVIAQLLENSLPPHLASLDRSAQLPPPDESQPDLASDLVPRSTPPREVSPPPQRRNVFDNDAFDRLQISSSQLHVGPKNQGATAETILEDRTNHTANKAAILSALSAFDLDDDEHDDTYDAEDVGASVDTARPGGAEDAEADDLMTRKEEALFRAWSINPTVFDRSSATRRGPARQALKSETGMTDEAIEGWSVMVTRDPRRLRTLEAKFSAFGGEQNAIGRTKWTANADTDTEGSGGEGGSRGGAARGGRGRARPRGRGRGGNVAGQPDDKGTQVARQRKEASKGSRANHNRRDQRARKMARGGFAG